MNYQCVTSLQAIRDYLGTANIVAFDMETAPKDIYRQEEKAALDPHRSEIVGVSFSVSEGTGIYVPIAHLLGTNADMQEVMAYLAQIVRNPAVIKIAHNLAFESGFLYKHSIIMQPPVYDTLAASQMTLKSDTRFRELKDSGLKTLVSELVGVELTTFEAVTAGRFFDELDPQNPETIRYACADSDYTLRLYHRFNTWFDRYLPKHRYIVEQVESPVAIYAGLMKYNGLLADQELMRAKQAEARARLAQLREEIAFTIGDVNIGANANTSAFKKYLFGDLGLPVFKTTAKYQEATDDEAMILLGEWCGENRPELAPLFTLVQEYRKWGKLKSTYINGYLEHINTATGRIHPNLLQLGAESGRFSCRQPNLQNQTTAGSLPVKVRDFIVAPVDHSILEADYSQIELRIAACLSQDRTMLDAYAGNEDIHAVTTAAVYGVPLEEASDKTHPEYKKRRTVAKSSVFGVLYGIHKKGLRRNLKTAAGIGFSVDECGEFINNLKRRYATLAKWQDTVIETAGFRRYAETKLGRRRYVKDISSADFKKRGSAERAALNHGVQGLAADILKLAMGRLVSEIKDNPWLQPVLTVHDSLVFYVPDSRISEAAAIVRRCMEAPPPIEDFNVAIMVDISAGKRYGHLAELEDRYMKEESREGGGGGV